jgi:tRNA nucleotidyltransferase (CCA-adding enzyme)
VARFYQVGGSVRDKVLGLPSKDIDFAIEADSFEAMRTAILDREGKIFLEKPEYLTIRANVPALGACDFVLCRKDGSYYDGRRPESVEPGTILDDLARRDFTINAMAIDEEGELIDPHGGEKDLRLRYLRCVGKAQDRFTEDGLRMLRALRFKITKNLLFDMDIELALLNEQFVGTRLFGVSVERVREELDKCFRHDTIHTLRCLEVFHPIQSVVFASGKLWLKPTLETR